MKKKYLVGLIAFITLSINLSGQYRPAIKFGQFVDYLENYYVDSIDGEKIVDEAIVKALEELDPHSTYISAEELKRMNEPLQGNFEGIGIQFNILKDTLYVVTPITGGPSESVGVMAGDKIIKVDGKNIAGVGITNDDVFSLLRGKKGTIVNVTILRRNYTDELEFKITRDKIPIYSIDASYMINSTTGYIKINRFSATTLDEFKEAVAKLKDDNVQDIIIDLTNNGGGYLDAAVKLVDEFLTQDKMIVYTSGLHRPRREYLSSRAGEFTHGKVIILIDEGSASASEIFSGAIQDWDRGLIIGRRSFGKGLVQQEMPLLDGSALRLTVANYYTPSGRAIQKPFNDGLDSYNRETYDRLISGELQSADSIKFSEDLMYKTLVNKRTVYGGGGIMPDIFVPFDTSFYSDYYRKIVNSGLLNRFALEYVDVNRNKLNKNYADFDAYLKTFIVDDKLLDKFVDFASKEGVKENREQWTVSKNQIEITIKALIARDLFGSNEFYQIYNTTNNTYLKALEVIRNWDNYIAELL